MSERHFVYIIAPRGSGGLTSPVKVGVTKSLGARLATLQTGCWLRLEVAYQFSLSSRELAYRAESLLHLEFADFRMQGEWFSVEPLFALEALCSVVFDLIEKVSATDDRQAELVESNTIDNLFIVSTEFWGLQS